MIDLPRLRSRLFKNSATGTLQVLVSGLALFLLYRMLLTELGPRDVGAWSLLMSLFGLSKIADLGVSGGCVKFAARSAILGEHRAAMRVIWTTFLLTCLLVSPSVCVVYLILAHVPALLPHVPAGTLHIIIVPAMVATWLGLVANPMRAGLDSFQRTDLRHLCTATYSLGFYALAWYLVPRSGLFGLLLAQCLASLVSGILASTLLVVINLRSKSPAVSRPEALWTITANLLRYGLSFQVSTIFAQLYEPLTKWLLGTRVDLTAVAWFELSSRVITQVRGLLVSAMEALVPFVSGLERGIENPAFIDAYRSTIRLNSMLSTAAYGALIWALPLISSVLLRRYEREFVIFSVILLMAWYINTLATPAYYFAQGLGRQSWNVIAHIMIGVLNPLLSFLLIIVAHRLGAVLGFALALIIGSIVLLGGFYRLSRIPIMRDLVHGANLFNLALAGAGILFALIPVWVGTSSPLLIPLSGIMAVMVASSLLLRREFRTLLMRAASLGGGL